MEEQEPGSGMCGGTGGKIGVVSSAAWELGLLPLERHRRAGLN